MSISNVKELFRNIQNNRIALQDIKYTIEEDTKMLMHELLADNMIDYLSINWRKLYRDIIDPHERVVRTIPNTK